MITLGSRPKRAEQVIAQKASSDVLLFNIEDGNYYSLNEIGGKIWELCDGNHSVAQVIALVASEYETSTEEIHKDVTDLLENLRGGKLIV
ncbi:MAG TPA: PqqD family protein [Candidatus Eremiobacteraceae bacterium]|nr:PqqD family protein [Candidatus Eremiobacteraceae bacterium]